MKTYRITTERIFIITADDEESAVAEVQEELHRDEYIITSREVEPSRG